jgi:hypothetical protein
MSSIRFEHLLVIYRAAKFEDDARTATVELKSKDLVDAVAFALKDENLDDSGISMAQGEPSDVQVGRTVSLIIGEPRSGLGILSKDFEDLLGVKSACIREPKRYFLIREGFSRDDEVVPADVVKYRKLLSFIALLKDCAAYQDDGKAELIFIHDGKFAMPVLFTLTQLNMLEDKTLDRLLAFFTEDTHREQKLSILTNTVLSTVAIAALNRRFQALLTELDDVLVKFADGYKLFVADFSYDKVRDEFETTKVEYAGKIHKVFTDIQNQLLSIPVATVIVATQMKAGAPSDPTIWIANTALLAGAWIFAVLFSMLCANQYRTLRVLDTEIKRQEEVITKDYASVASMFDDVYRSLHERIKLQQWFLFGIIFILVIALFCANIFYAQIQNVAANSQNAQNGAAQQLKQITQKPASLPSQAPHR